MQVKVGDRDFSAYNAAQEGRSLRPLAVRAVQERAGRAGVADGSAGTAVELGSGIGIEARYLAEHGYEVWTYDTDPTVERALRSLASRYPIHHTTAALESISELPACDLLLSCATLSFVPREAFDDLWGLITAAVRPGGVLAVDLFGVNDDLARTDGTYLARTEVEKLLEGWTTAEVEEKEYDGRSFSGAKHWHTFTVLAQR